MNSKYSPVLRTLQWFSTICATINIIVLWANWVQNFQFVKYTALTLSIICVGIAVYYVIRELMKPTLEREDGYLIHALFWSLIHLFFIEACL